MFYIFIAEPTAVLADCEADAVPSGFVIGAVVFGIEGFDWIATFYADGHFMCLARRS
jgi:hypothetical protein